jgi:hypothetical protein
VTFLRDQGEFWKTAGEQKKELPTQRELTTALLGVRVVAQFDAANQAVLAWTLTASAGENWKR